MKFWTWAEIRAKVERDLDLEGETFITPDEMLGYANEAIDEVERTVHTLCQDYFLTRASISLVQGQEAYDLPPNIYAMKVRSIVCREGASAWRVERIRDWHKFEQYETEQTDGGDQYQYGYFIINATAGQPQFLLAPTPTSTGTLKVWYLRNANNLVLDTDVCDIPEAANYVMQYIKVRCYEKEQNPMLQKAIEDLATEKTTTISTLSSQVVDNANEIETDTRLYDDMN